MFGVPEWSQAEVDAVMRLYDERGRMPKWKPIADELARMNTTGELNPALLQKGLIRSNNAVMNKVKEILYKELGDAPARVRASLVHASPRVCMLFLFVPAPVTDAETSSGLPYLVS